MAIRSEELMSGGEAALLTFPTAYARRRAARQMRVVYLRRRLAVAAVFLFVITAWLVGGGVGNAVTASKEGAPRAVTLAAGDTLWDVAQRYAPAGVDPRAYVDLLMTMNKIEGAPQAGMRLRLPH